MESSEFRDILRKYWGYEDFRGIQREIIDSISSGKDTLGLMPTGGGKSITFQVPAIAMDGVCIVVTPLIALMKDQVQHLRNRYVLASAIYSGMSRDEIARTLDNCILGHTKLLYVSPERLSSQLFLEKLPFIKVSFITVDEAHCISQWGYDFRPSYLAIADIRKRKSDVPILALTATATPKVVEDIQERLLFREKNVFRMSFARDNLAYVVRHSNDKFQELIHILDSIPGSAIIYTRSRKKTKDLADRLNETLSPLHCILPVGKSPLSSSPATFYHAGLEHAVKDQRQELWHNGDIRIMVATNAFGMGIDKADVRLVVHMDCPDSIEAYFQEAGRAGRDGKKSWAVLLYGNEDTVKLKRRIPETYPDKDYIKDVYEHLAYFFQVAMGEGMGRTYTFDIDRFCLAYHYFPIPVQSALHILQGAGYIEYETDPDTRARLMFLLSRQELYRLQELSPREEAVITAVLRLYGGVFNDYMYIDESYIAQEAQLPQNDVYLILKVLSSKHILHFIPQRKMPYITYLTDREDIRRLHIPPEIYEYRRREMEKRIDAVVEYATNDEVCRSRQLLAYFGEKDAEDCQKCDVCNEHRKNSNETRGKVLSAQEAILELLKDGKPHPITDLSSIPLPHPQLEVALRDLIDEETIQMENGKILGNHF